MSGDNPPSDHFRNHQASPCSLLRQNLIDTLIVGTALAFFSFHILSALFGEPETFVHNSTHLMFVLVLTFFYFPLKRKSFLDNRTAYIIADLLLISLSIISCTYVFYDSQAFGFRSAFPESSDIVIGTILIIIILEATRRVVGSVLVMVTGFFVIHSITSNYFFGFFYGKPQTWANLVQMVFMTDGGIFGIPLTVIASIIILYLFFREILFKSGAGQFFIDLAMALAGRRVGGPAKVAVIASALFGTMSGSAVANVVTVGNFTIPLMKRHGYGTTFAGGVEAVASSGGQIMPPIMGAAAFVIAQFLGISYWDVAKAAAIPAVLYFFSIYMMVHYEAKSRGLGAIEGKDLPKLPEVMKTGGHLLVPVVLIVILLISGYSPVTAGVWAIIGLFTMSMLKKSTRLNSVGMIRAVEEGGKAALSVSLACACAGIIIGAIFASGLGVSFSNGIISLAGNRLWLTLVLTMLISFILGMGMTTTADYIILAALTIPALIELGALPIAAHLFGFYFSSISGITPPVAMAAFGAAGISGGSMYKTGFKAMELGIVAFVIPFLFVYRPELLLRGPVHIILWSFITSSIGVVSMAASLRGWFFGNLSLWERIPLFTAFLLMIIPGIITDLIGLSFISLIGMRNYLLAKRKDLPDFQKP